MTILIFNNLIVAMLSMISMMVMIASLIKVHYEDNDFDNLNMMRRINKMIIFMMMWL